MYEPVLRRVACAATVYWEMDPAGPRVARLVVDVPLPPLEDPEEPAERVTQAAAHALARWMSEHPIPPQPPADPLPGAWEPSTSYGAWEVAA